MTFPTRAFIRSDPPTIHLKLEYLAGSVPRISAFLSVLGIYYPYPFGIPEAGGAMGSTALLKIKASSGALERFKAVNPGLPIRLNYYRQMSLYSPIFAHGPPRCRFRVSAESRSYLLDPDIEDGYVWFLEQRSWVQPGASCRTSVVSLSLRFNTSAIPLVHFSPSGHIFRCPITTSFLADRLDLTRRQKLRFLYLNS